MKGRHIALLAGLLALLYSCEEMSSRQLTRKVWRWEDACNDINHYKIAADLQCNCKVLQFLDNGELIVRQMFGWCGDEPVTHETVTGSWNKTSDSTYKLVYPFWGGKVIEDVLVIKISTSDLHLKTLKVERLR